MGKATQRIYFYLTPEQAEILKEASGNGHSDIIRTALQEYFERRGINFPMPPIERGKPKGKPNE